MNTNTTRSNTNPPSMEIERKYLVKKPSILQLSAHAELSICGIIQFYLISKEGAERRIRARWKGTHTSYFLTEKREITPLCREETEREISFDEYVNYHDERDFSLSSIVKQRICFDYKGQLFELDIFSFSDKFALMEIELKSENDTVTLPDFIEVIKEVTNDPHYRNRNLAKTQTL